MSFKKSPFRPAWHRWLLVWACMNLIPPLPIQAQGPQALLAAARALLEEAPLLRGTLKTLFDYTLSKIIDGGNPFELDKVTELEREFESRQRQIEALIKLNSAKDSLENDQARERIERLEGHLLEISLAAVAAGKLVVQLAEPLPGTYNNEVETKSFILQQVNERVLPTLSQLQTQLLMVEELGRRVDLNELATAELEVHVRILGRGLEEQKSLLSEAQLHLEEFRKKLIQHDQAIEAAMIRIRQLEQKTISATFAWRDLERRTISDGDTELREVIQTIWAARFNARGAEGDAELVLAFATAGTTSSTWHKATTIAIRDSEVDSEDVATYNIRFDNDFENDRLPSRLELIREPDGTWRAHRICTLSPKTCITPLSLGRESGPARQPSPPLVPLTSTSAVPDRHE